MVTKEDLQEKYTRLETYELFEIATNKTAYTKLANSVAHKELLRRKVTEEDILDYEYDSDATEYNLNERFKENSLIDLQLSLKMLFFFILWFPEARKFYRPNFLSKSYILKNGQSNYYSVTGFITFIVMFTYTLTIYPNFVLDAICILFCGFVFFYLIDIYYNRNRQTRNIQRALQDGKSPWNFFD